MEKSIFTRAWNDIKEKPLFYTGCASATGIVGFGLYGLRNRQTRMSLYLINLRLAAQGSFVALLTGGVGYLLFQRSVMKNDDVSLTQSTKTKTS